MELRNNHNPLYESNLQATLSDFRKKTTLISIHNPTTVIAEIFVRVKISY